MPAGVKSKSDWVRRLLDEGKTIAEITRIVPDMGYAFAYGIAKRAGKNLTAANRRPTRAITTDPVSKSVTVQTAAGPVTVHMDGSVTRPKVKKATAKVCPSEVDRKIHAETGSPRLPVYPE